MGNDYYIYFTVGFIVTDQYGDSTGEILQESYLIKANCGKEHMEAIREHLGVPIDNDVNILRCEVLGSIDNISI